MITFNSFIPTWPMAHQRGREYSTVMCMHIREAETYRNTHLYGLQGMHIIHAHVYTIPVHRHVHTHIYGVVPKGLLTFVGFFMQCGA